MLSRKLLLLVLILCLRAISMHGAEIKRLKFEPITISEGLSQGMINCMLQDSYGFMWFATKDGLNRYDGYRFVVYKHDPSDHNSIADNFLEYIFEDSQGRLWIGTSANGLDLFNRETESFIHFRHDPENENSLINDQVTGITEDAAGNIWVSTLNGLNRITITYNEKSNEEQYSFEVIDNNLCRVFVMQDGSTKVLSEKHLYTFGNVKRTRDTINLSQLNCAGQEATLLYLAEDASGIERYYIYPGCVVRQNSLTGVITSFETGELSFSLISNVWKDPDDILWICENNNLVQLDMEAGKFSRVLSDDINHDRMIRSVSYAFRDRSDIVWIGTKGFGLLKYNPRSEKFHHFDHSSIGSIVNGNGEDVLICRTSSKSFLKFNAADKKYSGMVPDLPANRIPQAVRNLILETGVMEDDHTYWLSMQRLIRYDKREGSWKIYDPGQQFAFPVFRDSKSRIWCGTENSFCMYDNAADSFRCFPYPVRPSNVPYKFLQVIHEDTQGNFWLGTTRGLFRFSPDNRQWKQYRNRSNDSTSLSFDLVLSLCPDPVEPEKYLWVGTNGGLNKFDMHSGKVTRYSEKDGLPNNVIYGILRDRHQNLWMSTNKGLTRFNVKTGTFRNFDITDGLQSNEFSRYAYCTTPSGMLYFGGVNGFNYFNPDELVDNKYLPEVHITDFKINNISISFKDKNTPLEKPIYLTEEIELDFTDNMISFDFAAFDFTSTKRNQYQYIMEGFDEDWIQSGTNHSATYTNLYPGTYFFRVKGSNSDNVWSEKITSIKLTIHPPWYMTWWFRMGVALVISLLIYALYSYRLRQKLKLLQIRNNIASDLHDEIGSTLSSVSLFSEIVKKRTEEKFPEIIPMMTRISDNINTMMEAMSDIVWTINARNDRFENIINRMRSNAAEIFEAKGYTLHLDFDESLNKVNLGMEQRKNVYLIFKEAINNIAKYADGRNVYISLKLRGREIRLEMRDDGVGFDPDAATEGNGILSMKRRAAELKGKLAIKSEKSKGTEIVLTFPITRFSD